MRKITSYIDVMTPQEVVQVHETSLKILETVGIGIPNDEVLKLCEEVGGVVDYSRQVVTIPARVMEDLLGKVKTDCYNEDKLVRNQLNGSISTQIFYYDYHNKARRYGVMDDIFKGIKLLDQLDNFGGSGAIVVPSDIPHNCTDVVSFHAVYAYAKKAGGTFILSPTSAKYIVEMSKVMGRGTGYFLETISPLKYAKESLETAMVMRKMGCGISIGPMVIGGATGPITIAGNCALQNAEILGSIFTGYALNRQTGYGYGSYNHAMDLRTMVCSFGSPSQALLGMAAGQMGRYYGLWSVSNSGLTDALIPDYQCGMEKASNAIFSLLAGNAGIGGQGIVGADQGISLEQLVLDNEFMSIYNHIMSGFEVSEETLALDLIQEIGIGGNFVSEEHTVMHMRDSYFTTQLFNRDPFGTWEVAGSKSSLDKAHEYVGEAIKGYDKMEPVVSPEIFDELTRIKCAAEEELRKEREGM